MLHLSILIDKRDINKGEHKDVDDGREVSHPSVFIRKFIKEQRDE